jgi:hypothetical protein
MSNEAQRAILEQLTENLISMDEAESQLAALDETRSEDPAGAGQGPVVDTATTSEHPDSTEAMPAPTRVLREVDSVDETSDGATMVSVRLHGASLINAVGVIDADEPYLEGPHTAIVKDVGNGYEVTGELGDDGLLVLPRDVDLVVEANSGSASVRGIRGSVQGVFNVGDCGLQLLARGDSRIVANVGRLQLAIHPASDVQITLACATNVTVGEGIRKTGRGVWTIGSGTASLEIGGTPGQVSLDLAEA